VSGSFGNQSSSQSSKTNETVTKTALAEQMPAWNSIWHTAGTMADSASSLRDRLAPTAQAYTTLGQQTTAGADAVRQLGLDTVGGKYLDANTYLNPAIDAATRGTWEKFNRETLPALAAYGNISGAYGGDRQSLAVGQAGADAAVGAADIAAQLGYQNYQAERQRQIQGADLLGAAASQGGAGAGYTGEGATIQDQGQAALLGQLAEILSAGGFGTQSGTSTTKGKSKTSGFTLGFSNG